MSYWTDDTDIAEAKIQRLEKKLAQMTRERDEARDKLDGHCACRFDEDDKPVSICAEHLEWKNERDALRAELERERMRLAACGAVALANTPETAAEARNMRADYRSASCDDVARVVDSEMRLRAENERLQKAEADFHMTYRLKCDSETKALRVEVERFRAAITKIWDACQSASHKPANSPELTRLWVAIGAAHGALQEPTP